MSNKYLGPYEALPGAAQHCDKAIEFEAGPQKKHKSLDTGTSQYASSLDIADKNGQLRKQYDITIQSYEQ